MVAEVAVVRQRLRRDDILEELRLAPAGMGDAEIGPLP
jgi:hypothetical protein